MKSLEPGYVCLLCRTKGGSISMTLFRRRFNIYLLNLHRIEGESGGSPGTGRTGVCHLCPGLPDFWFCLLKSGKSRRQIINHPTRWRRCGRGRLRATIWSGAGGCSSAFKPPLTSRSRVSTPSLHQNYHLLSFPLLPPLFHLVLCRNSVLRVQN